MREEKYKSQSAPVGCPEYETCQSDHKNEVNCKGNIYHLMRSVACGSNQIKQSKLEEERTR